MKRVGFFGSAEEIAGATADVAHSWEPSVTDYLRQGAVVLSSPGWEDDRLNEDVKMISGSAAVLTDGEWIWPGSLAYYVSTYHVNLPGEFIDHVASHGGKVASVGTEALDAIADWLMMGEEPGVMEASSRRPST
ncbi:hypothetical protein AB0J86_07685 [Micromonospora sp. NPDC049559]|uniref:hypothetical protein n=1 Tax=Micromonospora sp. NPDC049559 TaxID=3155923 RepID=UPI0034292C3E